MLASKELMIRKGDRLIIDGRKLERLEDYSLNNEYIIKTLQRYKSMTMDNI